MSYEDVKDSNLFCFNLACIEMSKQFGHIINRVHRYRPVNKSERNSVFKMKNLYLGEYYLSGLLKPVLL